MKNDYKALLISAHRKAFTVAGCSDTQTVIQCQAVIHRALYMGASLRNTNKLLQILFVPTEKVRQGCA